MSEAADLVRKSPGCATIETGFPKSKDAGNAAPSGLLPTGLTNPPTDRTIIKASENYSSKIMLGGVSTNLVV